MGLKGHSQFITRDILNGKPHRAFDDCESVYWLCFIALFWKCAGSELKECIEDIIDSSKNSNGVQRAKESFIGSMIW